MAKIDGKEIDGSNPRERMREQSIRFVLFVWLESLFCVFLMGAPISWFWWIGNGNVLARFPSFLQSAIPSILLGWEGLALLGWMTIPGILSLRSLPILRKEVEFDPANPRALDGLEMELLAAYGVVSVVKMGLLLGAEIAASLLFCLTCEPWALANLVLTLLPLFCSIPIRSRMEQWARRRAAVRIGTIPPPGYLD